MQNFHKTKSFRCLHKTCFDSFRNFLGNHVKFSQLLCNRTEPSRTKLNLNHTTNKFMTACAVCNGCCINGNDGTRTAEFYSNEFSFFASFFVNCINSIQFIEFVLFPHIHIFQYFHSVAFPIRGYSLLLDAVNYSKFKDLLELLFSLSFEIKLFSIPFHICVYISSAVVIPVKDPITLYVTFWTRLSNNSWFYSLFIWLSNIFFVYISESYYFNGIYKIMSILPPSCSVRVSRS